MMNQVSIFILNTHDVGNFAEAMLQAKELCALFRNKGIKQV